MTLPQNFAENTEFTAEGLMLSLIAASGPQNAIVQASWSSDQANQNRRRG